MNKTMQELFAKKNNDEYNISKESKEYKEYKEYYTQINIICKIKKDKLNYHLINKGIQIIFILPKIQQ